MAGQSWEAHESVPALETLHHDLLRFRREHAELQHALQRVIAENEELYATMAEHLATREELAQAREQAEWEEGHGLDDAAADVVEEVECLRGHAEVHEAALRHLQQGYRLAKQQAEHEHQLRMAREAELGEMRTIKQSFQLELGRALQVVTQLERALQSSRDRHRERDAEEQLLRQTLTQAQAQCRNSSRDAKPVPHDSVPAKGEAKPEAAAAQSHGPLLPSPDDPAVLKRRLADLEQSLELERERSSATRARELARVMQASQEREHALQQQIATHTQEIQLLKTRGDQKAAGLARLEETLNNTPDAFASQLEPLLKELSKEQRERRCAQNQARCLQVEVDALRRRADMLQKQVYTRDTALARAQRRLANPDMAVSSGDPLPAAS